MTPSTRRPRRPEQALHKAVAQFLTLALPSDAWWTTFPLGGGGKLRGALLKGAGTKVGTPDVLVIYRGRAHWFELKALGGRNSPTQWRCQADLQVAGCYVDIAYNITAIENCLRMHGVPLRASSGRVGERAA